MPLHPLTSFEIQKYYQNKPKCNDVHSRDNLPKTFMSQILMSILILEVIELLYN